MHVQVGPPEEVRLDDKVVQMKRALANALLDLAVRAREAARVRHHADLASLLRRGQHVLGVVRITASTPGRSMHSSRFVDVKGILYSSANFFPLSGVRLTIETISTPS